MSIQAGINQLLGMSAIAARLSPGLAERAETRSKVKALDRQEKAILKQQGVERPYARSAVELEINKETQEALENIRKQKFELNPSAESLKAYKSSKFGSRKLTKDVEVAKSGGLTREAKDEAMRRYRAMMETQKAMANKIEQRDAFKALQESLKEGNK